MARVLRQKAEKVHYSEREKRQIISKYTSLGFSDLPEIIDGCSFYELRELAKAVSVIAEGK